MAYYKALARHGASSKRQDYLERRGGDRALARDLVNIGLASDAEEWGRCMDETRRDAGNDRAWRGRRAVTYQEFILSPDPRDGVSLEQMRELALSWAEQWFGERGKLGPYQVAIVYHDDNERSITHAHVHVNNTNLDTGRRLHIDNADVRRLRLSVQGECERRALRHFSLEEDRPGRRSLSRAESRTREEIEKLRAGELSWKEELRRYVEVARRTSRDEGSYRKRLEALGVRAEERGGDLLLSHPARPDRWRCLGETLGHAYSLSAIRSWHESVRAGRRPDIPRRYPEDAAGKVVSYVLAGVPGRLAARIPENIELKEAAYCLAANDRYGIRSMDDYDRRMRNAAAGMRRAGEGQRRDQLAREYAELARARRTALQGDFFPALCPEVRDAAGGRSVPQGGQAAVGAAQRARNASAAKGRAGSRASSERGSDRGAPPAAARQPRGRTR